MFSAYYASRIALLLQTVMYRIAHLEKKKKEPLKRVAVAVEQNNKQTNKRKLSIPEELYVCLCAML